MHEHEHTANYAKSDPQTEKEMEKKDIKADGEAD